MKNTNGMLWVSLALVAVCFLGCPTRPQDPQAAFDVSERIGDPGLNVEFSDLSDDGGATITDWLWDFGDGTTSTQANPVHTYDEPGAFSVSLTVTTSAGSDTDSRFRYIIIDDEFEDTFMLPGDVPLTMVLIPAGTFNMGALADELDSLAFDKPSHSVELTHDFWIGKYEVTKAQWEAIMETRPWEGHDHVIEEPDSAAVFVSWNDTQTFLSALSDYTSATYRLPTEAEWEYSCRAGTTTRFYWGDDLTYTDIDDYAWWGDNAFSEGEGYAHIVGLKLPNDFGLYDMSGNAWEWCQDWFDGYPVGPVTDPAGPVTGTWKICRGGGWYNSTVREEQSSLRSACRNVWVPTSLFTDFGFRLCLTDTQ